jgi:hypothetical protein
MLTTVITGTAGLMATTAISERIPEIPIITEITGIAGLMAIMGISAIIKTVTR